MGRRPIGDHAMTPAERKARQVQKQVEQQLERRLQEIPRRRGSTASRSLSNTSGSIQSATPRSWPGGLAVTPRSSSAMSSAAPLRSFRRRRRISRRAAPETAPAGTG